MFSDKPEKCNLVMGGGTGEDGTSLSYRYKGTRSSERQSFVLLLNPSTQECTLHSVSDDCQLNLEAAPPGSAEESRLADYPKVESKGNEDEAAREQSAVGMQAPAEIAGASPIGDISSASSDSDDLSEIDESNPFDFRRYLDESQFGSQSYSPDLPASHHPKGTTQSSVESIQGKSLKPLPEPRSKATFKSKTPESRSQQANAVVPEVRLDRRASTHNGVTSRLKTPRSRSKPQKNSVDYHKGGVSHISPDSNGNKEESKRERKLAEKDDERDDGEVDGNAIVNALEIDYGDEPMSPHRGPDLSLPLAHELNGPISLRSAANSASPSSRLHTPKRNHSSSSTSSYTYKDDTMNRDVIEFPNANHSSDGEDEYEQDVGYPKGLSEDSESAEGADLPSTVVNAQPHTSATSPKQVIAEPQVQEFEDEDDADLEAEMREGLADEDDDLGGTGVGPPPDSESESEAE